MKRFFFSQISFPLGLWQPKTRTSNLAIGDSKLLDVGCRAGDRHRPGCRNGSKWRDPWQSRTINFDQENVYEQLNAVTEGRGPDRCIDAVESKAHGNGAVDAVRPHRCGMPECPGDDQEPQVDQAIWLRHLLSHLANLRRNQNMPAQVAR